MVDSNDRERVEESAEELKKMVSNLQGILFFCTVQQKSCFFRAAVALLWG